MSRISTMMDIGRRSLSNSQTALQTVAHNIANKGTEGYSRQRVEIETNVPQSEGRLQLGTGAKVGVVTRTNNPWMERQVQREKMNFGFLDGKADALERAQEIFNEQGVPGLNHYMTEFFNAFRELANTPESLSARTLVKEKATALINDFHRVHNQLSTMQADLDNQISNAVTEINSMVKEISQLNEKIKMIEIQNIPANDERDRRDVLLKHLGEKIDIAWAEGTDGLVTVTAAGTAVLCSGLDYSELRVGHGSVDGRKQVLFMPTSDSAPVNITNRVTSGTIGGVLNVRDGLLANSSEKMDQLALTLTEAVNSVHREGLDQNGQPAGNFFREFSSPLGAAGQIHLDEDILESVGNIAAGVKYKGPADNSVANAIAHLQFTPIMNSGLGTFDDFYNSQVGEVGAVTKEALHSREAQKNIVDQLENIRESISGVSLDEETTKIIDFQKTYDASARVIRTADEMLDTVLNLKRL